METNMILTKENVTVHDFKRVCRTCLSTVDLQPISDVFDSAHFPVEIALNKYTQVQFDPLDKFPKQICSKCVQNLNSSYNFLLNCDLVNTSLKVCLARYEHNLQAVVYLPNAIEYVNCQIKQEPAEFNLSELETEELPVTRFTNIEKLQMAVDIKEEAPGNSEDENYSDNFDPVGECSGRKTRKRRPKGQMQFSVKSDGEDIIELAETATNNILPEKSRDRYENVYRKFMEWRLKNNSESFSENVMLAYFQGLSDTMKPSSLWAIYSMLRTTISINHGNTNIAEYPKLIALLKMKSRGFKSKKSKTLNSKEINNFLQNAPDNKYLFMKVVLIIAISGGCRKQELRNIMPQHVEDTGKSLIVHIPDLKTPRSFVVPGTFYKTCKKYMDLRPSGKDFKLMPFFLKYMNEKCTKQCVGINKFASVPQKIAEYLGLPDTKEYTGHCFKRSSATILFDAGK